MMPQAKYLQGKVQNKVTKNYQSDKGYKDISMALGVQ